MSKLKADMQKQALSGPNPQPEEVLLTFHTLIYMKNMVLSGLCGEEFQEGQDEGAC